MTYRSGGAFFGDSEHLAPIDDDLDLQPGWDRLE
jgi:hypothetical protein